MDVHFCTVSEGRIGSGHEACETGSTVEGVCLQGIVPNDLSESLPPHWGGHLVTGVATATAKNTVQ